MKKVNQQCCVKSRKLPLVVTLPGQEPQPAQAVPQESGQAPEPHHAPSV
jgi:hypothetical protein